MKKISFILFSFTLFAAKISEAAVVLIYHHVSSSMPASTSIAPEKFIAQMDYLVTHDFKVVPLSELVEKIISKQSLPDKTVAITFDDAYADVYTSAFPILKSRHWPFTFFINTDAVSSGKLFVSWDQLREMSKNKVMIANHSHHHDHMVRKKLGENDSDWRTRITNEIQQAQQKIEWEIGSAPKIFAYPFGEYNTELNEILKQLGYVAFTQQAGVLDLATAQQILPRFAFGGSFTDINDFAEKINTLSLPINKIGFFSEQKEKMDDLVMQEGSKPYLVFELADKNLLPKINCFSSAEGKIPPQIIDQQLWVQPTKPLSEGRTKINCTAPSGQPGRYYWFTQLWLVTDKKGNWNYSD